MKIDTVARGKVILHWLGQAGFWINLDGIQVLIDPYLSDSLAKKYAGQFFPHTRMMNAPISVDNLPRPDVVLITHAHTDHMDPETLRPLAARHPNVPFLVPAATSSVAFERIANTNLIKAANAGDRISFDFGLNVQVFPSAHEDFDVTSESLYPYLGYGIENGQNRIYHSGDTIPFCGLTDLVTDFAPLAALLPINGRDDYRRKHGVPGNMNAKEAVELCRSAKVPNLVPHHFGMFEFNTADDLIITSLSNLSDSDLAIHLPSVDGPVVLTGQP